MFQSLSQVIQTATNQVEKIETDYIQKRQETAVKIQKEMESELERMKSQIALEDYSPIGHHNKIVTFNNEYQTMNVVKQNECEAVKIKLFEQLLALMDINPCTVKEMYKVISASSNNQAYICRVWFTLVDIEEWSCVPGDPIRIEWVQLGNTQRQNDKTGNISATSNRTAPDAMGLKIPQFDSAGRVTHVNNFYNINNWGEKSNQRTWWEQWVEINRPVPKEEKQKKKVAKKR